MFFFVPQQPTEKDVDTIRFELSAASELDLRQPLASAAWGVPVPVSFRGTLSFGSMSVPIKVSLLARLLSQTHMHLMSQEPLALDMRALGFPVQNFSAEFGLIVDPVVRIGIDVKLPYRVS
jgi:hypothetical protein